MSLVANGLLGALVLAAAAYALMMARGVWRVWFDVPLIRDASGEAPVRWPALAVIVPACDEAATIAAATESRMALDYPELAFVYVNDRSTDDTGAILEGFAARDARMRVLHVKSLPAGWLGKVHALARGCEATDAEWLLFTDADVHLAPDILRRAMSYALTHGLDHLAVFPSIDPQSFAIDAALASFSRLGLAGGRVWRATDPTSHVAIGVGAFNLVRREMLARAGGMDALRLEVSDDVGLAQRLKAHGARTAVFIGTGAAHLMFYPSIAAMARGAEKAALAFDFNVVSMLSGIAVFAALELGPFVVALSPVALPWRLIAGLSVVTLAAATMGLQRRLGHSVIPAIAAPLGSALMLYAMARGGLAACLRGALEWRGTRYPAAQLVAARTTRFV